MIVWFGEPLAALLTTTSSRPHSRTVCSTRFRHCSRSPVSVGTTNALAAERLDLARDLGEVVGPARREDDVAPVAGQSRTRWSDRCRGRRR